MSEVKTIEQVREEFENVTDGLGMPLDEGIKELVVMLNYHGIVTHASCEGHENWGLPHPWVDVYFEHIHELMDLMARFKYFADLQFSFLGDFADPFFGVKIVRIEPNEPSKEREDRGWKYFKAFEEYLKDIA